MTERALLGPVAASSLYARETGSALTLCTRGILDYLVLLVEILSTPGLRYNPGLIMAFLSCGTCRNVAYGAHEDGVLTSWPYRRQPLLS